MSPFRKPTPNSSRSTSRAASPVSPSKDSDAKVFDSKLTDPWTPFSVAFRAAFTIVQALFFSFLKYFVNFFKISQHLLLNAAISHCRV